MSNFAIAVESGKTVKLPTAGKYCDRDILVTATGSDDFWEAYQHSGQRENYEGGFAGNGWTDETFKPKYNIVPSNMYTCFRKSNITDLVTALESRGVMLDAASANNMQYAFYSSAFTRIGVIDCSNVANASLFTQCFASCTKLVTIDKLKLATTSGTFSGVFDNTPMLENITIEGEISRNGLNFNSSVKLTHDSLMSILGALADYSEDTSGTSWVLTLGETNLAKLTDAEKAIATEKGWTLV